MTNVQDRTHDRNHLHRRAFLAATTGALALAGSRTSFAQNQSPDASVPMSRPAMPNNVKVDRLVGSSERTRPATGSGRSSCGCQLAPGRL